MVVQNVTKNSFILKIILTAHFSLLLNSFANTEENKTSAVGKYFSRWK